VQEQHAAFTSIAERRALENVHQFHERLGETENGVAAFVFEVFEEGIVDEVFFAPLDRLAALRKDHVVQPLEGVARDAGVLPDDIEIIGKRTLPVLVAVGIGVLPLTDLFKNRASITHGTLSFSTCGTGVLPRNPCVRRGSHAQAKTPRLRFPRGRTQRGGVTIHGQITELLIWGYVQTGQWTPGRYSGADALRSAPGLGKPHGIIP
jgi:hypothetical protein